MYLIFKNCKYIKTFLKYNTKYIYKTNVRIFKISNKI